MAVVSAIFVITQKNVVHSAVFLAGTLLAVAGIFLTLHAEFLAGVQVIVYVGGILVLFVFVIMLIALDRSMFERQYNRQWTIALVTTAILIVEFAAVLYQGQDSFVLPPAATWPSRCRRAWISRETRNGWGWRFILNYLLPFEIASILLLVAIVGAVVLSKRKDTGGING